MSTRPAFPMRHLAATFAAMGILAGCIPAGDGARPQFPFAASYLGGKGAPVLLSNANWWQGLRDPVLERLVAMSLRDSPTLEAARQRVIAARAERDAIPGAATVELSAQAGARGTEVSGGADIGPDASAGAGLGLGWLFDPWGRRAARLRAADARSAAAAAERDAAQLLLLYSLCNAYLDLRFRQEMLALRRAEADSRARTLALTRQLDEADAATRPDVLRSEARVQAIRAELPGLRAAVAAAQNQIAVLAGVAPGALPPDLARALEAPASQPGPRLSPEVGIPADLLRNRPDIRIAEQLYLAALADTAVARAGLYPSLSLSGTLSLSARRGGGSAADYFLGPAVTFPVLPGAPAHAAVAGQEARAREAHAAWKATVLEAIAEVENALADYAAVAESMAAAGRAARLYAEARAAVSEVFAAGNATLGDLIDAEQEEAAAKAALAEARYRRNLAFVALNVRLGSGHAAGE